MLIPFICALGFQRSVHVRLVVDEPKQALAILNQRQEDKGIKDSDWNKLFQTEGYKRLKDREAGMKRPFTDDGFKKFMLSDGLLTKRVALQDTLSRWEKTNVAECGKAALAYLPAGSSLRASVYLLIKPLKNSFVWDTEKNPAIMLYMDPEESADELAMTIAHEFHHIGYDSRCPSPEFKKWKDAQPKPVQTAYLWIGAFGEGHAVLASAGGLDKEPYGPFRKDVKDAFAQGIAHLKENMAAVQSFFADVLGGKLSEEQAQGKAVDFYGMVGPWYTVGYVMDAAIEKAYGRPKLIECLFDPRLYLPTYNKAAQEANAKGADLPLWTAELVAQLGRPKGR